MVDLKEISHAKLLKGLTAEDLAELGRVAHNVEVGKGEYLFHLGDDASKLYIIQRGLLQLTLPLKVRGEAAEIVTEELSVGDSLAWSALIPPHAMTMSARATSACRLIAFERAELEALFERTPVLGRKLMANIAGLVSRRLHVSQAMWVSELQDHVIKQYG